MTKENRAERRICPDCETNPILRSGGEVFCDVCNKYMEQRVLTT